MKENYYKIILQGGMGVALLLAMFIIPEAHASDISGEVASDAVSVWEKPLRTIASSLSGPIAQFISIVAIVMAGLGLAFGEGGAGTKKILMIVLGIAIAVSASGLVSNLFGFAGTLGV